MAISAWRSTRKHGLSALLVALFAAFGLVVGFANAAQAAPSTSSSIVDQINAQWLALEPTLESYDLVHEKLQKQQAAAVPLEKHIADLSLGVQVQLAKVGSIASTIYQSGPTGTFTTLLIVGTSGNSLNMLGEINQLAANQRAQVAAAVKLQKSYEAQAKPVNALIQSLQIQQTQLTAQKATIQKKIDALDAARIAAFGTLRQGGSLKPAPCPTKYTGDPASRAAKFACDQIGKEYVWDADGPNTFDCSGLTLAAWRTVGVSMPHNAYVQSHTFPRISAKNVRIGDLVFYYSPISHVTIYVGDGWVVSAPTTGEVIRMKRMDSPTPTAIVRP